MRAQEGHPLCLPRMQPLGQAGRRGVWVRPGEGLRCAGIQPSTPWGLSTFYSSWVDPVTLVEAKQAPCQLVLRVLHMRVLQVSGDSCVPESLVLAL